MSSIATATDAAKADDNGKRKIPTPNPVAIAAALRVFIPTGHITEIRILNTGRTGTVSGYYDNLDKAATDAGKWNGRAPGVYFTPNVINPALLARASNRLMEYAKNTTSDNDVIARSWLLLDFDPTRPAGISSTNAEHDAALDRATACRDWLTSHGWPAPVFGDSGNGAHLNYRIDLPNDDTSLELVKSILAAAAFQFSDDAVSVDLTTSNAARIWKLYGTVAAKGDAIPDRPHRFSRLLDVPNPIVAVPRDLLELVANMAPKPEPSNKAELSSNGHTDNFDLELWIKKHGLPVVQQGPWEKGHRWILNPCPWNQDHTNRAAFILRFNNGAIAAGCRHNGCAGKDWHALRDVYEPGWRDRRKSAGQQNQQHPPCQQHSPSASDTEPPAEAKLPIITLDELVTAYPRLRPSLIEGLLRQGETCNIIAAPKVGKSWLTYGLALSVVTGRSWLDTYPTTPGKVLIIDNELHPETTAHRLPRVAQEMQIHFPDIKDKISVLSLRGRLKDLPGLESGLLSIERGRYLLIIIDAWYRVIPAGADENDNGTMARMYDRLDYYAQHLGASFALIHHASKGDQSSRAITDVGSGAGAQSRATDTHLILRPHEEQDAVVLEAAVRSWPPVSPLCLRWTFPLWTPAPELDPLMLRQPKPRRRKPEGDEPAQEKAAPWTAKRFAETFGSEAAKPRSMLLEAATQAGLSDRKAELLLRKAVDCEYLFAAKEGGANSRTLISSKKPEKAERKCKKRPKK